MQHAGRRALLASSLFGPCLPAIFVQPAGRRSLLVSSLFCSCLPTICAACRAEIMLIFSQIGSCLPAICAACRAEIYVSLAYVYISYVWFAGRRFMVISAQFGSCLPVIWAACRVEKKTKTVSEVFMVPALLKCVAVLFCVLKVLYLPMHLPHCLGLSRHAL